MSELLHVSVIVPAYNAEKTLSENIEVLLAQDYPKDKIEIIIVDDGSTDATSEIAKQYSVRYIYQENKGPAAARNSGWKMSNGEIICFTDSDCIPEKEWVRKLINRYNSDKIGGVGGSYDSALPKNLLSSCVHEEIIQRHFEMPEKVDYLGAFNLSYRKSVLEDVDGFDESYRMASGEDNDIAYRILKRGYHLIFDKDIKVTHYHPTNLLSYLKRQFWHGYWRMKIYHDHYDMAGGDRYAGFFDLVQPPLALATLALFPFLLFYSEAAYIFITLLMALLVVQFPMPLKIINRTDEKTFFVLIPVTFLRGYARGLGMALGINRFFVLQVLGKWRKDGRA